MSLTIGEASAINTLVMALTGRLHPVDGQPISVEQQQTAVDLLITKAHKVLMAGLRPGEVTVTEPVVQIIHSRDPDQGCGHTAFLNSQPVTAWIDDIDPGRGYDRREWNARVNEAALAYQAHPTPYREALWRELEDAADSEYLNDYTPEQAQRLSALMSGG